MKCDIDDIKKLVTQLTRFDVFKISAPLNSDATEDMDASERTARVPLIYLANNDIAPCEVETNLLTSDGRRKQIVVSNVKHRLINESGKFHDVLQRNNSKTFADLYRTNVSTRQSVQKTIKAGQNLLQCLLNAVNTSWLVEMVEVLRHELSPTMLLLANPGGEINSTPRQS